MHALRSAHLRKECLGLIWVLAWCAGAAGDVQSIPDQEYGPQDFFGLVDEMRVWRTVRTPEEVRWLTAHSTAASLRTSVSVGLWACARRRRCAAAGAQATPHRRRSSCPVKLLAVVLALICESIAYVSTTLCFE